MILEVFSSLWFYDDSLRV